MSAREPPLDPLELSIRARRGELSEAERRLLERGLGASALADLAHQTGRDFDVALRVRPGDEALLERVSRAALGRARTTPRPRRSSVALLGFAAALVVGSAGASVAGFWKPASASLAAWLGARGALTRSPSAHPAPMRPVRPQPSATAVVVSAPAPSVLAAPAHPAAPPLPSASAQSAFVGSSLAPKRTSSEKPSPQATPLVTGHDEPAGAASLFRAASAARRRGELAVARQLYARLQAGFPASEEASVSRVSLGRLLLEGGDFSGAERQFARYLGAGGTTLAEEALVGRAQSLAGLGEHGEERRVWLELLARFGNGVYTERARARLGELERLRAVP